MKLRPYKSYRFLDKDPIIDKVRTVVQDSELSYREINEKSGVSVSCISNWFNGGTRRPQFATVEAVSRACGKTLIMVDLKNLKGHKNGG